jgi:prepilin-type N-terminal cleavage/methylation domain-containing protein
MVRTTCQERPGYALLEVLVSVVIVGVLLAIFTMAASDSRRNASLSASINNLKQFAWAGSTYAADCDERFWTFSWTRTDHPPGFTPSDDLRPRRCRPSTSSNAGRTSTFPRCPTGFRTSCTATSRSWIS